MISMEMARIQESSFQDRFDDLTTQLSQILDLDKLEAKIYLNLLRTGPITASALAKEIDIDRARMYRTIDKLLNRNVVSTTFSSPKLCIAIEPEEALKLALRKKEEEVNRIKKSGEELIEKIKEVSSGRSTNIPTFRVVQGRSNIYADVAQLIENSTDIVFIATALEDISRMYHSVIPEKILTCEKNGGEVRLLVDVKDVNLIPFIQRFNATEARITKLPSKGRIIVQKEKQMIMSDSSNTTNMGSNAESDFSLCTNSPEMIYNIYSLCNFLWSNAQPLNSLDFKKYAKKIS